MAEREWYLGSIGGNPVGPCTASDIAERWGTEFNEDSLCWTDGMTDWMPVQQASSITTVRYRVYLYVD